MSNHVDASIPMDEAGRQQIHDLETALEAAHKKLDLYQSVLDSIPNAIYTTGVNGQIMLVNQAFVGWMGRSADTIIGQDQRDLFPPDRVAAWKTESDAVISSRQPITTEETAPGENGPVAFLSQRAPLFDQQGQVYAIAGMATDISELRRAQREREMYQEQVIQIQQVALRELSTPLIPIVDGVVVMPLIGSLDSNRAQQVLETLLSGVVNNRATTVIMDVTGLPVVDTQVASVLLGAAQTVKLLGAEVILTGISPEVAQTLIGIGTDLSSMKTPGTLQNGIAYALKNRSLVGAGR
jgi:rsbT co-antagonist protein RsbR